MEHCHDLAQTSREDDYKLVTRVIGELDNYLGSGQIKVTLNEKKRAG